MRKWTVPPVVVIAMGTALLGCSSSASGPSSQTTGCTRNFAASLFGGKGQPTPIAAAEHLAAHQRRLGGVSIPRSGWTYTSAPSNHEATVKSGITTLHAVQGADGHWQIDSGQTACTG